MEKKIILRGVAILCAGISASIFAVDQLSGNSRPETAIDFSQLQAQPTKVVGASLVGGSAKLHLNEKTENVDPSVLIADAPETDRPGRPTGAAGSQTQTNFMNVSQPTSEDESEHSGIESAEAACSPTLSAAQMVDALIELSLDAPCHPDERLVISHNDLVFSAYTNAEGAYSAFIPALSADAKIDVFLAEDIYLQAALTVPEADDHVRVALQWSGEARFALHAYHDGASHGESGHVHALRPFDPNLEESFLISLGEPRGPEPMIAEIYSVPATFADKSRLEIEFQFTEQQCGQDFSAFLADNRTASHSALKEISFAVADCPSDAGLAIMAVDLGREQAGTMMNSSLSPEQLQD